MNYARRTILIGVASMGALTAVAGPPKRPDRVGTAPAVGDVAPDFSLRVLNSDQTVTLSERLGKGRPVVLVFGSYT